MSFSVISQPPLPLQEFVNLQACASVLQPPIPLQSFCPEQPWAVGAFLTSATFPGAGAGAVLFALFVSLQPCCMAAPLISPVIAAAIINVLDVLFIICLPQVPLHTATLKRETRGWRRGGLFALAWASRINSA